MKESDALRKVCPVLGPRLAQNHHTRHHNGKDAGSTTYDPSMCLGRKCNWWCGDEEGDCVVKVIAGMWRENV